MDRAVSDVVRWRRSSFCEQGACVEAALVGGAVAVRNSRDADGRVLTYPRGAWQDFLARAKNGDFDAFA